VKHTEEQVKRMGLLPCFKHSDKGLSVKGFYDPYDPETEPLIVFIKSNDEWEYWDILAYSVEELKTICQEVL